MTKRATIALSVAMLACAAFGADVFLGRRADLTWTGTGPNRLASFGSAAPYVNTNLVGWWKLDGNGTDYCPRPRVLPPRLNGHLLLLLPRARLLPCRPAHLASWL